MAQAYAHKRVHKRKDKKGSTSVQNEMKNMAQLCKNESTKWNAKVAQVCKMKRKSGTSVQNETQKWHKCAKQNAKYK